MKTPGRWMYEVAIPAIVIEQRFLDMVFEGRKCWELRKRQLPLLTPVLLVAQGRLGERHVAAVAVFDTMVADGGFSILGDIVSLSGRKAGKAGVNQKWVDDYAKGKTVFAHRYWCILAFEPDCEGAEEVGVAQLKVILGTDDREKMRRALKAINTDVVKDGVKPEWLARFGK